MRAQIAQQLLEAHNSDKVKALIARAPDFISLDNSTIGMGVFTKFVNGQSGQFIGDPETYHTYIYVEDAAKATALLGNTEDAYGQVWHLPSQPKMKGKEWIELVAKECGVPNKYSTVPRWMFTPLGWFMDVIGEFEAESTDIREREHR